MSYATTNSLPVKKTCHYWYKKYTNMKWQQQLKWKNVQRDEVRKTDEGRTTDRPLLLFGDLFSPRAGPRP